jgi:hypothetical protein
MEMMNRLDKQGDAFLLEGDFSAAWTCYRQALILRHKVNTPGHSLPPETLQRVSVFLETIMADRPAEALPYFEEVLTLWQQLTSDNHP